MEKIKGLAIELDMDHLSVDRGLKGLKDNLRTVNSEMKRNMSAFDRSDRSVAKYETSLSGLNKKLEVQKVAVAEAKKEYEAMVDEYGHGSKEAEKAAREYNNQAASLNNLERYIERTKKELADFEKQQRIANSGWTKMGDKLQNYGGKLKTVGSQMEDVGSKMTNKITKPALVATTAAAGLVGALGWKRLTGLDSAQAQLKGLGYSTKEVGRISDQVTTAIDGGMTTMAEGTAVAAGALAAGVKEGKELERYIKLVGDAAVGANRPVEEMAMIFNRVQGNGKLMTQELNSIEQGMPGFSKAMSKHLGVSSEKFREMVTDGKVSSKDFLKVMEDFAGGMASAYAESWDGMVANTKAYIGIIGENFLRGIFQDSKKSLADFIEMLKSPEIQQRAAEMGETARVAFGKMKDSIMGVVEWYQNLDDGQKQMIHTLGLMAVAGGPVLQFTGKLTKGLGSVFEATSKVSKAIGIARGAGLVAGLASLGPGAIAGVAVVGIAAVAAGLYTLHKRSKEAEEANLDVAKSLSDEAVELENAANTFDKLSDKAKISNAELAELNDLNKRIAESSNPGEIEQLQKQYNELAKKSGLSKDELEKLFGANDTLIKQSPDIEKSISDQGSEFVTSTEAVDNYVQSMYDLSRQALSDEIIIAEENKREIIKDNKQLKEDIADLDQKSKDLRELEAMSEKERNKALVEWQKELTQERANFNGTQEELNKLKDEEAIVNAFINEGLGAGLKKITEQRDKLHEKVNKNEEELEMINALDNQMSDIILKQVGINEEGEKGLAALEKSITKNDEDLAKLDAKLEKNGQLTTKEQERYDNLSATNEKQREARDYLFDELGLYKDLNSLAEARLEAADKDIQKKVENHAKTADIKVEEGNIIKQIEGKNSEIDKSISKLEKERGKQGANKKEIDEQIKGLKNKKSENEKVIEKVLKELGVWDEVKDSIKQGTKSEKEKAKAVGASTGKLDAQGASIDQNNIKTYEGVKGEQERTKEASKSVDKTVTAKDRGTVASIDRGAQAPKSKRVSLFERGLSAINIGASSPRNKRVNLKESGLATLNRLASSPVTKTISFVGRGLRGILGYEKGTPASGHPGGDFVAGEKGEELGVLPNGTAFLTPKTATFFPDMPRGTHIIPHRETKQFMRNIPGYADGTPGINSELARLLVANNKSSSSEVVVRGRNSNNDGTLNDLLKATLEQNKILMKILAKDPNLYIDGDVMASYTDGKMTDNFNMEAFMRGQRK